MKKGKFMAVWVAGVVCMLMPMALVAAPSEKPEPCPSTPWPYSRTQPKKDLYRLFESLDRSVLMEYYIGELTSSKYKGPSVARELSIYLAQTEFDEDYRKFIKFLAYGAEIKEHPRQPKRLDLGEVCEVYNRIATAKGHEVGKP